MQKTHVLFDFFGTLVRYSPSPAAQAYRRTYDVFTEAGYEGTSSDFIGLWSGVYAELEAQARRTCREFTMHTQATVVAERGIGRADRALVERLFRTYLADWNVGVRHIEGVSEMIERLAARYAMAVVSNTHDTELVPEHLAAMRVDHHMEVVVTSAELGVRKPATAIFEHALDRLEVSPQQCVYVGDTFDADYLGATNAGLSCFLIDADEETNVPDAHRLSSIAALPARLAAIG